MPVTNEWKRLLPRKEFLALALFLAILYLVSYITSLFGGQPLRGLVL